MERKNFERPAVQEMLEQVKQGNIQCIIVKDLSRFGREISKPEYLAAKAAFVKQRDTIAARIAEMEATLENMETNGSLQNKFVSTFEKHLEVEKITSEIVAEVLKEVRIYPDRRLEIIWNFRDEPKKLILDLQGDHQNGE